MMKLLGVKEARLVGAGVKFPRCASEVLTTLNDPSADLAEKVAALAAKNLCVPDYAVGHYDYIRVYANASKPGVLLVDSQYTYPAYSRYLVEVEVSKGDSFVIA